ncbi:MAG: threonine dehydratase [Marivirga sp.]|jgi:threonine dehydratase
MKLKDVPLKENISEIELGLRPFVHRTAIFSSDLLNKLVGCSLFFKSENLQKGGSFKIRGAMNALLSIDPKNRKFGVATHSSGNHAQALAIAARQLGMKAWIVMPSNSPAVKVAAVKGYGGEIIICEPNLLAREEGLKAVVARTNATFIPPYNSYDIIGGQATLMKEFIEDTEGLEACIVPIGGGGLISGAILAAKYFGNGLPIYGAEPTGADDAFRSLLSGKIVPMENPDTIADGLRTSLGSLTFPIIKEGVKEILTVSDEEIIDAMKLIYQYLKLVIEPSAAVPLAALIKNKDQFQGMKIGLVLCGGNIDLGNLPF